MRALVLSLAFLAVLGTAVPQPAAALPVSNGPSIVALSASLDQDVPKDVNVDIKVNRPAGRWYASPVWIAIGAIAAVVVLLLLVLIARGGGGTTIVRE